MLVREIREEEAREYDSVVDHPLQTWEWGEFRREMGSGVVRLGVFEGDKMMGGYSLYSTKFPRSEKTVWLCLRGPMPDGPMIETLRNLGRERNAILVKLEPNLAGVISGRDNGHKTVSDFLAKNGCVVGKPFFAGHTFWIDLAKSSAQLLSSMKEKTRYNIGVAQKHGVVVDEEMSDESFEKHLGLMFDTTRRQGFSAHDKEYHRKMWKALGGGSGSAAGKLTAHLLQAKYKDRVLVSWILFRHKDILYYPYGASSEENREVMASYAMMWAAIEYGKGLGCKRFDLWGAAAPGYGVNDPWAGFTRFKEGFGGDWVEFVGSYDLVIDPLWYRIYQIADKLRGVAKKFGVTI